MSDPLDEALHRLDNLFMEAIAARLGISPVKLLPQLPPEPDFAAHLLRENDNLYAELKHARALAYAIAEKHAPEFRNPPGRRANLIKMAKLFADFAWEGHRSGGGINGISIILAAPDGQYAERYPSTDAADLARTYRRYRKTHPIIASIFDKGDELTEIFVRDFALQPG